MGDTEWDKVTGALIVDDWRSMKNSVDNAVAKKNKKKLSIPQVMYGYFVLWDSQRTEINSHVMDLMENTDLFRGGRGGFISMNDVCRNGKKISDVITKINDELSDYALSNYR